MQINRKKAENLLKSVFGEYAISHDKEIMFYCPSCKHHKPKLSFNIALNAGKCWVCDERGTITKYLRKYGSSAAAAQWRALRGTLGSTTKNVEQEIIQLPSDIKYLSEHGKNPYCRAPLNYLKKRYITDDIIKRYKIGWCDSGRYANRIIFPSFDISGRVNFFISRTIYEEVKLRYLMPRVNKNEIIFNELLISFSFPIVLTEGVFDALRIENSIPLLGSVLSKESKLFKKIVEYKPLVYLGLDKDAKGKAVRIANLLAAWGVNVAYADLKQWNDLAEIPTNLLPDAFSSPLTGSFKNNLIMRLTK